MTRLAADGCAEAHSRRAGAHRRRAAHIDSVFADVDRRDGPGCAVGVTRAGRLAYAEGYGRANLDYRRPITPETVFDTASLSKQFTAAAVVLAARQGHLSLDEPGPEIATGASRLR